MIDRENRNKVAEQARHYISGLINNDELDDSIFDEFRSDDIGLKKVTRQLWFYYDDLTTHKNEGKHKLSKDDVRDISRYILFLKSDLEYQWPSFLNDHPVLRLITGIITLGLLPRFADRALLKKGPVEIWPFFSEKDYQEQLDNPKYMRKNA